MTVGITELPPEGMQLPGVALAGDADRGTKTTEGISLLFTSAGITVQGPQPQIERLLVWTALDSAACREVVQLADGRDAAILELTSGGQSIRFLLPSDTVSPGQAAYLDQALPTWLARYKGPTPAAPQGAEAGASLPAPGPTAEAAEAAAPPAPTYVTAGVAAAAAAVGATVVGQPDVTVAAPEGAPTEFAAPGDPAADVTTTGLSPQSRLAPPPPPPAPAGPPMSSSPPPPAPTFRPAAPPAPSPFTGGPAPAAPGASVPAPAGAWDQPPLGSAEPEAPAKTPWYKLAPRKAKAAEVPTAAAAAAAVTAAAPAPVAAPPTPTVDLQAPPAKTPWYKLAPKKSTAAAGAAAPGAEATPSAPAVPAPTAAAPTEAKTPWYKLAPRKPKDGATAAAATAVTAATLADAAAPAPTIAPPAPTVAPPAPTAPPAEPVRLAVQPPPPVDDGTGVVLADAKKRPNRAAVIALVALLVLVVAGGAAYVISKRNPSTTTPPPVTAPATVPSAAADTALAAGVNLRLTDLPTGWTQVAPAEVVVRPPVAPAVAQSDATNTMASCLNTSFAVVSGLFGSGSLPGQTSLVQSPIFQSAAGSSFEMGSKTITMASPGQVQALDGVFTDAKFDTCYQQYAAALAAGAVPGATAAVQPVTLPSPAGVQSYGLVTTYTLPGAGTAVVGDAWMLGGRVVSVLQPTTSGAAIPGAVFTPAYTAVVGRVAAAAR